MIYSDADDHLLNAPDRMMKAYCNAVGIRYNPGMTSWEPGMIHDWSVASESYLYQSFAASTADSPAVLALVNRKNRTSDAPVEVSACISESWHLYQEMYAERLVVR